MKKMTTSLILPIFLPLCLLIASFSTQSQNIKYSDLDSIGAKRALPKNLPSFQSYLSKDGYLFQVGDSVSVGKPKEGMKNFNSLYLYKSIAWMRPMSKNYVMKKYRIEDIKANNGVVFLTAFAAKKMKVTSFDLELIISVKEVLP